MPLHIYLEISWNEFLNQWWNRFDNFSWSFWIMKFILKSFFFFFLFHKTKNRDMWEFTFKGHMTKKRCIKGRSWISIGWIYTTFKELATTQMYRSNSVFCAVVNKSNQIRNVNHTKLIMCDELDIKNIGNRIQTWIIWHCILFHTN